MADNNPIVFLMPTMPAVKQYLKFWNIGDPYKASKESFIGSWLINAMSYKIVQVKSWNWDECKGRGFTEGWKYTLPVRYADRCVLPDARVREFNQMIYKTMVLEIIHDIEYRTKAGETETIIPAIEDFRDKYGIWDYDMDDERVRKMYYRFRKSQEEKKNNNMGGIIASLLMENIQ